MPSPRDALGRALAEELLGRGLRERDIFYDPGRQHLEAKVGGVGRELDLDATRNEGGSVPFLVFLDDDQTLNEAYADASGSKRLAIVTELADLWLPASDARKEIDLLGKAVVAELERRGVHASFDPKHGVLRAHTATGWEDSAVEPWYRQWTRREGVSQRKFVAELVELLLPTASERRTHTRARAGKQDRVEATQRKKLVREVVGRDLAGLGFTERKDGSWVRRHDDEITFVVELLLAKYALSGGFLYGASLAFVPSAWRGRVTWHRTLASARLDVAESREGRHDNEEVDLQHGPNDAREDLATAWAARRPELERWLAGHRTVRKLLAHAVKIEREDPYGVFAARARLARAFGLAHLGRAAEGRALLTGLIRDHNRQGSTFFGADLGEVDRLRAVFETVVRGRTP